MRWRKAASLLAGLLAGLLFPVRGVEAQDGPRFERPVRPGAAGPNRLEPDVPLLTGAARLRYDGGGTFQGGLEDLRLADRSGREVPYLVVAPAERGRAWRPGRLLPVAATRNESGFEVDLGAPVSVDRLSLSGLPAPFLKRFRLEGGGDRSRWTLLAGQGTLFDLPDEGLRQTEVEFPAAELRYLRVTWDDRSSGRLPFPESVEARLARPADPPPPVRAPLRFERRESEPGKSRFRVHLPGPGLPVVALELKVGGGHLLRPAKVAEGRLTGSEVLPAVLGESTLRRAVRGELSAADLRIPIAQPGEADLELIVDDGNNPPLALEAVSAELAPLPWIYFETDSPEPLTARFGDPAAEAPRYDLEAIRQYLLKSVGSGRPAEPARASWGAVRDGRQGTAAASGPLPPFGAALKPEEFPYSRKIPGGEPGLTSLLLDAAVLARSAGLSGLRIVDARGRQVPYLLERRDEPLALDLPELRKKAGPRDLESLSRYGIEMPYATLPDSLLTLGTTARVFEREVRLAKAERIRRRSEPIERTLATATWRNADPELAAPPLTLEVPPFAGESLDLLIDEGDNVPLPLGRPRLLLPTYRLRFFHPEGAELRLLYGKQGLAAPRYDLALLAPRLMGAAAREASLAPEAEERAKPEPADLSKKIFWGVLAAAVVVLLLFLVRLLKEHRPAGPGGPGGPA